MSDANQMIVAGIHAVATAAQITRTVQANLEAVITLTKDDRSPVTVADLAAQAVVALLLEEHLPDPADRLVVGEEDSGALQDESMKPVRDAVVSTVQQWRPSASEQDVLDAIDHCDQDGSADGYWTLDPIDGTDVSSCTSVGAGASCDVTCTSFPGRPTPTRPPSTRPCRPTCPPCSPCPLHTPC